MYTDMNNCLTLCHILPTLKIYCCFGGFPQKRGLKKVLTAGSFLMLREQAFCCHSKNRTGPHHGRKTNEIPDPWMSICEVLKGTPLNNKVMAPLDVRKQITKRQPALKNPRPNRPTLASAGRPPNAWPNEVGTLFEIMALVKP